MKQLNIFVEGRSRGELAKITAIIAAADININEIDVDEFNNIGIVHMTVDRFDDANALLRDNGYEVIAEEALVVKVEDKPGSLAKMADKLAKAGVNVRSMRIVRREAGLSFCAIVPEPIEIAAEVLKEELVGI